MSASRWQEVTATFHRALERPPADRAAFLAAACAEDSWLRQEVETLLASYDHASDTSSFAAEALEAIAREPAGTLAPGQRLGRYEVEAPLGAGGMGAVYAARDTTLLRRVALKVLPGHLAADPAAMARFQQEARLASSLNHPNIVTVYEIGAQDGVPFIATELIEGQTLRARLTPAGLGAGDALPLALQAASALAAAHEAGVVHRDVKPENVMVRPDGLVKVLDFGLAKPEPAGAPSLATAPGLVMGTVSYMSPEQARGQEVDARSDVWSLGVVLYEMLAGRAPFTGASTADVLVALLEREPPPLPALEGTALSAVVMRCLAKDRAERYRTAGELLGALRALPAAADDRPRRTARKGSARGWILAAAGATLAAVLGVRSAGRPAPAPPPGPAAPALAMTQVTHRGNVFFAATSRDGARLAFVVQESGQSSLWVRRRDGEQEQALLPPVAAEFRGPSFSPDGRFVYLAADFEGDDTYALYRVPVEGGPREVVVAGVSSGPSFSPDGARMAFVRRLPPSQIALMVAAADGSGARALLTTTPPGTLLEEEPAWSPDGRAIAAMRLVADARNGLVHEVLAVDAATGAARALGEPTRWRWAGVPAWVADGSAVLLPVAGATSTSGQVVRVPYPAGAPVEVTHDANSYLAVAGTGDPTRFIALRRELISSVWVAEPGGAAGKVTPGEGKYYYNLGWTPDGRIVCSSDVSGSWNLWAVDPATRLTQRLTNGPAIDAAPDVSPEGQVVFQSTRGGSRNVWVAGPGGGDLRQLTFGGGEYNPQVSPQGWVAYTSYDTGVPTGWRVPLAGGTPVRIGDGVVRDPTFSSDGRWIAGHAQAQPGAPWRIGVFPAEGTAPARMLEVPGAGAGWQVVRWVPNSEAFSYIEARDDVHNIWSWTAGRAPRPLTRFDSGRIFAYAWSRDGRRLALIRGVYNRDLVEVRTPE